MISNLDIVDPNEVASTLLDHSFAPYVIQSSLLIYAFRDSSDSNVVLSNSFLSIVRGKEIEFSFKKDDFLEVS